MGWGGVQGLGGGSKGFGSGGVGSRGTGPRDGANFATCVFLTFLTLTFFEGCPVGWGGGTRKFRNGRGLGWVSEEAPRPEAPRVGGGEGGGSKGFGSGVVGARAPGMGQISQLHYTKKNIVF